MSTNFTLPAYVGIILKKDTNVFLVQRNNTNWMQGYWNFPGGLVEENETLLQAAVRETQEELGAIIYPDDFKLIHVIHVHANSINTQDILGFYFMAQLWEGAPKNNEPAKIINAQWFDINNLPDKITEHALLALDGLKKNSYYSENGW